MTKFPQRLGILCLGFALLGAVAADPTVITRIEPRVTDQGTELVIEGTAPFSYTSYKPDRGTIIVELSKVEVPQAPNQWAVGSNELTAFDLKEDSQFGLAVLTLQVNQHLEQSDINYDNNRLVIQLRAPEPTAGTLEATAEPLALPAPTPAPAAPAPAEPAPTPAPVATLTPPAPPAVLPSEPATTLINVEAVPQAGRVTTTLHTDGLVDYTAFELENPARLVIDLLNLRNRTPRSRVPMETGGIQAIRVAQFQVVPDPITRVVFDLSNQPTYLIRPVQAGLEVVFGEAEQVAAQRRVEPPVTEPVPVEIPAAAPEPETVPMVASLNPGPMAMAAPEALPAPAQPPVEAELIQDNLELSPPATEVAAFHQVYPAIDRAKTAAGAASGGAYERAGASSGPAGDSGDSGFEVGSRFEAQAIEGGEPQYTGVPITLDMKQADVVDILRLFSEFTDVNLIIDESVSGSITLRLEDVPWDQALDLILRTRSLGKVFEGNIMRIAPLTKLAQEQAEQQALKEAAELAVDPVTITRALSYTQTTDAVPVLQDLLSQRGKVIENRRTNTLIITDIPQKMAAITRLLETLDQPNKQVMIEARVVETTKNYAQAFGIQWGFRWTADPQHGNTTDFKFPNSIAVAGDPFASSSGIQNPSGSTANPLDGYAVNLPIVGANSGIGLSFGNILNTFRLDIGLAALESKGKAQVISSPRVVVQDNESATIESGVQIPVVNTTATEIDVRYQPASLRLLVVPHITAEGTVLMDITLENNSISNISGFGDNPAINTRRVQTRILVRDGGTTVIGGVYKTTQSKTQGRVPFFHRIPLIGWLFRNRQHQVDNDELLIFLTPRIMPKS